MSHNELVIEKIEKLIPEAPSDWARIIAKKMEKSESSVRAYAKGEKGLSMGHHITVLELLIGIVNERKTKIEKLTA